MDRSVVGSIGILVLVASVTRRRQPKASRTTGVKTGPEGDISNTHPSTNRPLPEHLHVKKAKLRRRQASDEPGVGQPPLAAGSIVAVPTVSGRLALANRCSGGVDANMILATRDSIGLSSKEAALPVPQRRTGGKARWGKRSEGRVSPGPYSSHRQGQDGYVATTPTQPTVSTPPQ